jgi:hypothetical protein
MSAYTLRFRRALRLAGVRRLPQLAVSKYCTRPVILRLTVWQDGKESEVSFLPNELPSVAFRVALGLDLLAPYSWTVAAWRVNPWKGKESVIPDFVAVPWVD